MVNFGFGDFDVVDEAVSFMFVEAYTQLLEEHHREVGSNGLRYPNTERGF